MSLAPTTPVLSVRQAEKMGARVMIPPTVLPEGDEMAVLQDPEGMPFAVWRRTTAATQ